MHDRPTRLELLDAVRHFLETDVVPALEGTKKFHARVAANVLVIVARELESEPAQQRAEWRRLRELLGEETVDEPYELDALKREIRAASGRLCERIRSGDADAGQWRTMVVAHVRQTVIDKLAVANPRSLGISAEEGQQ